MLLHLKPDSPTPIYEQIVTQIIYAVASGGLAAESLVPSVRELAGRLLVNPNTVARAYQELEARGVLIARRGRGMEVTAEAPKLCRAERQSIVQQQLRATLREAVAAGLAPDDLERLVTTELHRANGKR